MSKQPSTSHGTLIAEARSQRIAAPPGGDAASGIRTVPAGAREARKTRRTFKGPANNAKSNELSPPENWLARHGHALYRYAYSRLRDASQAEDLVQETLLGALRARHAFGGRAAERTWLIGILKNKLVDYLRKGAREQPFGELPETSEEIDALFDARERWKTPPSDWGNPTNALEQKQFWKVFADGFAALPARQARVFALCELDGLGTAEACKVFGITATNVWVILHRARLQLRQYLDVHWFGSEAKE